MAKQSKTKKFTFNDESQNSYGFIIPTKGISLKRFKKNPMMLDSHYNSTHSVIGKWENVTAEGAILSGEPLFDSDDELGAKIEGKVERGFINSCSMGITFKRENLRYINEVLVLEKCELYEVSIVAVPSNANSIRLYAEDGKLMQEDEVEKLCLSALPEEITELITPDKPENSDMKKVQLSVAVFLALGFPAGTTEVEQAELEAKINTLTAEKNAAELKLSARVTADEQAKLSAINGKVDAAITAGKFKADQKDQMVQLGIANESLLDSTIEAIPEKASLGAQVKNTGTNEVKTVEDFQKLSFDAQLAFKQSNPAEYQSLFTKN